MLGRRVMTPQRKDNGATIMLISPVQRFGPHRKGPTTEDASSKDLERYSLSRGQRVEFSQVDEADWRSAHWSDLGDLANKAKCRSALSSRARTRPGSLRPEASP